MSESYIPNIVSLNGSINEPRFDSVSEVDWVWVVKQSDYNPELAHSIRSVDKNVNHRNVVLAGYKPFWINDKVIHINRPQPGNMSKYYQSAHNLIAACYDERVSEKFVLMNDDFFVMKRIKELGVYYRADLKTVIDMYNMKYPNSGYLAGMKNTYALLRNMGIMNPLSYELHVPMMYEKKKRIELLEIQMPYLKTGASIHTRTLYGNLYGLGGERMLDCKIVRRSDKWSKDQTFLSTSENSFPHLKVGAYIQDTFRQKSKYEK